MHHYVLVSFLEVNQTSHNDSRLAYLILQRQIEYIDGDHQNIVIPSVVMKKIREEKQKHSKNSNNIIRIVILIFLTSWL